MRKRRDRGHKRGRLRSPPPGARSPDPSPCHPGGPRLPRHPRSSRASRGPAGRSCLCADPGGGGGPGKGGRAEGARERAARPRPPSGCPWPPRAARSLFPPGARARGGGLVPGGAQAGAARYLRVFVQQGQALLGHFEALGQPFAQPFHGLVVGHGQVVASPRGAVDRQGHGCGRLRGRAQLAGAAGGPAPAAPGAAGLRLHPRRAQEAWGPRVASNPRRDSPAETRSSSAPRALRDRAPLGEGPHASKRAGKRESEWCSGVAWDPWVAPRGGVCDPVASRAEDGDLGTARGGSYGSGASFPGPHGAWIPLGSCYPARLFP